jgi:hypothetical protein
MGQILGLSQEFQGNRCEASPVLLGKNPNPLSVTEVGDRLGLYVRLKRLLLADLEARPAGRASIEYAGLPVNDFYGIVRASPQTALASVTQINVYPDSHISLANGFSESRTRPFTHRTKPFFNVITLTMK